MHIWTSSHNPPRGVPCSEAGRGQLNLGVSGFSDGWDDSVSPLNAGCQICKAGLRLRGGPRLSHR